MKGDPSLVFKVCDSSHNSHTATVTRTQQGDLGPVAFITNPVVTSCYSYSLTLTPSPKAKESHTLLQDSCQQTSCQLLSGSPHYQPQGMPQRPSCSSDRSGDIPGEGARQARATGSSSCGWAGGSEGLCWQPDREMEEGRGSVMHSGSRPGPATNPAHTSPTSLQATFLTAISLAETKTETEPRKGHESMSSQSDFRLCQGKASFSQ